MKVVVPKKGIIRYLRNQGLLSILRLCITDGASMVSKDWEFVQTLELF